MSTIFIWYGHATIGLETAGMHLLIDRTGGNLTATPNPQKRWRITSSSRTGMAII